MLYIIRDIHNKKIIHRDLKPANFMLNNTRVTIIDFGLSKLYELNHKHICKKKTKSITGNLLFCSPYVQIHIEPSRRDDLISLGYCFMYLIKRSLPWTISTIHKKLSFDNYTIYNYTSQCAFLFYYFKYCFDLEFDDSPDYSMLIHLIKQYPITT